MSKSKERKVINLKYHPKLLKIFTKTELALIIKNADFSYDDDNLVDVIVIHTNKIIAEIYTDLSAEKLDHALILNLKSKEEYKDLPDMLTKEQLMDAYINSEAIKSIDIGLNV